MATDRERGMEQREAISSHYRKLIDSGLGTGSSGNLSIRTDVGMLITPTGIQAADLSPEQLVEVSLDGNVSPGQLLPSSEWHMHAAVYRNRPEIESVVHCHSRYATILACAHRTIPAIHYMIAATGGEEVPLAPYATFGTNALAASVLQALQGRLACLLANHGAIVCADTLPEALALAQQLEILCRQYLLACELGEPQRLTDTQWTEFFAQMKRLDYGRL